MIAPGSTVRQATPHGHRYGVVVEVEEHGLVRMADQTGRVTREHVSQLEETDPARHPMDGQTTLACWKLTAGVVRLSGEEYQR